VSIAVDTVELVKKRLNLESQRVQGQVPTPTPTPISGQNTRRKGNTNTNINTTTNTLYENDNEVKQEYDVLLRNKIQLLTTDTNCLHYSLEEGTNTMKIDAEIEESHTIVKLLTKKMSFYSETLENLVYERDVLQEKLRHFHEECDGITSNNTNNTNNTRNDDRNPNNENKSGSGTDSGTGSGTGTGLRDKILILRSRLLRYHGDQTNTLISKRTTDLEVNMIRSNRNTDY